MPIAINVARRSQIAMNCGDNIYVVLQRVRIATASRSTNWTNRMMAFDGVTQSLDAFEVTVGREWRCGDKCAALSGDEYEMRWRILG